MRFSKTELELLSKLSICESVKDIAEALQLSRSQIYRNIAKLQEKEFLRLDNNEVRLEKKTHVVMLANLLSDAEKLAIPLSETGLHIYTELSTPKTLDQLIEKTGLHKTTILKKINQGRKMSLLIKDDRTYRINEKIWPKLIESLESYKEYQKSIDERIPIDSVIYYKTGTEIIFSNKKSMEATSTAFSAYERYGIKVKNLTNYYYLPIRKLSEKDILNHSLKIIETENTIQKKILTALFYLKYKNRFTGIKHPILENIKSVLKGKKIKNYPSKKEILDKAEVYNVK